MPKIRPTWSYMDRQIRICTVMEHTQIRSKPDTGGTKSRPWCPLTNLEAIWTQHCTYHVRTGRLKSSKVTQKHAKNTMCTRISPWRRSIQGSPMWPIDPAWPNWSCISFLGPKSTVENFIKWGGPRRTTFFRRRKPDDARMPTWDRNAEARWQISTKTQPIDPK